MKAQDLKNSILQLAIQGKLVPQDPNDESAEVLYAKIQAEKQKLIKEGKIKKDKPLPPITNDEVPFSIPPSWKWVRHNDLFEISGGSQPPKSKFIPKPKEGYIRLYQIRDYGNNPQPVYIPQDTATKISQNGDILLARYGASVGKIFYAEYGAYNVAMAKVIALFDDELIFKPFLFFYYHSSLYQKLVKSNSRSAQAGFNKEDLESLLLPLPPLAEQKRIVAKIEELEPLVKQYDKAETELSVLNDSFPEQLKKSILQYAIQGKLVPQDANDEPAEVLYANIQAEKQKLVKEGKIKKDKPLPPITDDEIPFEIPSTWKWVRLGDCFDVRDGTHDTPKYVSNGVPLVTSKNLCNGILDLSNVKFISLEDAKKIDERSKVDRNDILFAMIGTIGNPVIVNVEPNFCIKNMALIKYNKFMDTNYILYLLIKAQDDMKKEAQGAVQSFVSLSFIRNFPIPLPPLAEQHRIVAKIEELMQYCDKLKI